MTTTYSPHHDGGGTLHLPSPTHLSRTDSTSTLAQLRRSLSKSPSKHSAFRLLTSNSASPSPRSPLLPQPRASSVSLPADENALGSSPLAAAFPHSATKTRPPMRRLSPMSTAFGSDLPRSPAKRPLSECTDNGNATPQSSAGSSSGGEKESSSPVPIASSGSKDGRKGPSERRDQYLSPNVARVRKDRPIVGFSDISVKSSPLKRSDESSNQDLIRMGSPAKRRSLHFPSIGSDFDIFDQSAMQQQTQMGRSNSETLSAESPTRSEFARSLSPLPKRASSLRKTTLQQRHDKPTYPKAKPNASLALEMQTPGPANMKSRQRLSLDNQIPHPDRGSPFSNMGGLPNASVHPIHSALNEATVDVPKAPVAKHPLSRTLTTSSTSSFGDDSPTHIPIHHAEPRKPRHDFSKSLPLGAARPASKAAQVPEPLSQETDFSTPENYKLAKPLPAAFMSTGLISKRQKNLSQDQLDFSGSLGHMPDTPCKRAPNVLAAGPAPTPKVHAPKMQHSRPFAHAFGTPSTPINSNRAAPAPSALGKGTSIFGSSFNQGNLTRRGSFISDEGSGSPLAMFRNSTVMAPPTPTKQPVPVDETPSTEVDMHDATTPGREGSESPFLELNCKSQVSLCGSFEGGGYEGAVEVESPSTALRFRSFGSIPSFSTNRFSVLGRSRSSVPKKSLSIPIVNSRNRIAKPSPLSPASPIFERHSRKMPQTPSECMVPPDPSSLSISGPRGDNSTFPPTLTRNNSSLQTSSHFPPATPTAHRDSLGRVGSLNTSVTPVHHHQPADIDAALTSRFDKVEVVGNGEFSQVFRVTRKADSSRASARSGYFAPSFSRQYSNGNQCASASRRPQAEQVWAVKKARNAFLGPRDRKRKMQEVEALRALGHDSAHTLHFFDSWETNGLLYIQTEYCDEKSLDAFLDKVGRKWRLDDFRIWKIMLELSLVRPHLALSSRYIFVSVAKSVRIGAQTHTRLGFHSSRLEASQRTHHL